MAKEKFGEFTKFPKFVHKMICNLTTLINVFAKLSFAKLIFYIFAKFFSHQTFVLYGFK